MEARTRKYRRLPPDTGIADSQLVHAAGFGDIEIDTRKKMVAEVRKFLKYCRTEATSPAARVVLGEWGQGKTDLFYRYVQPEAERRSGHAVLIAASSVANSLARFEAETPSESRRFLAATFDTIREECDRELIPPRGSMALDDWLIAVLERLTQDRRGRSTYVFMDEMEELVHDNVRLRQLMQGVKETLNGQFAPVSTSGQYGSSLFFFLACTPEAWYRICDDPDVREVYGGFGRRLLPIRLAPVTANEGVDFLFRLLLYSYDAKLPQPLPLASVGILYNLVSVTRGNLGLLVSLFSRLMSSIPGDSGEIEIVDSERLLDFLGTQQLPLAGGESPCMEPELLRSIQERLNDLGHGDIHTSVFRLLLGEHRPFTIHELGERLFSEEKQPLIRMAFPQLEEGLRQLGYASPILKLRPASATATFDDLWSSLSNYHVEDGLRFREAHITRAVLIEKLTYLGFGGNGQLKSEFLLPADEATARAVLGDLTEHEAGDALTAFASCYCTTRTDEYFLLSSDIIEQVLPPPSPPGLEFIPNKAERLSLWREATREFTSRYSGDMPKALAKLLAISHNLNIRSEDSVAEDLGVVLTLVDRQDAERPLRIRCLVVACPGDPAERDLQALVHRLDRDPTVHVGLVVHSSSLATSERLSAVLATKCPGRSLVLHIHPTFSKQLLAAYWAVDRHRSPSAAELNATVLAERIQKLFTRDIQLRHALDTWYPVARRAGIMANLALQHCDERELLGVLRQHLNGLVTVGDEQTVFSFNREKLRRFVPFGSKTGVLPDVAESLERFQLVTADLKESGFLETSSPGELRPCLSPVETRIRDIVRSVGILSHEDLVNCFVVPAGQERRLTTVYIRALEERGLIVVHGKRTKPETRLVDVEQRARECIGKLQQLQAGLAQVRQDRRYSLYAHVFVAKERDSQIINVMGYSDFLEELSRNAQELLMEGRQDQAAAVICLINYLLTDFSDSILDRTRRAARMGLTLRQQAETAHAEITSELAELVSAVREFLPYSVEPAQVSEIAQVEQALDDLIEWDETDRTDSAIKEAGDAVTQSDPDVFGYSKVRTDDTLNVRLWHVKRLHDAIRNSVEDIHRRLERLRSNVGRVQQSGEENRIRMRTMMLDDRSCVSTALRAVLMQERRDNTMAKAAIPLNTALTLDQLEMDLDGPLHQLTDRSEKLTNLVSLLEGILQDEQELLRQKEGASKLLDCLAELANEPPFCETVGDLQANLDDLESKHTQLGETVKASSAVEGLPSRDAVRSWQRLLQQLSTSADNIREQADRHIWQPFAGGLQRRLATLSTMTASAKVVAGPAVLEEIGRDIAAFDLPGSMMGFLHCTNSMRSYSAAFHQLRGRVLQAVRALLDANELTIWEQVICLIEETGEWIDCTALAQRCQSTPELPLSLSDVIEALVAKGFLKKGVSLPG